MTYDATTIHNTIAMAETFQKIGYPPTKVRYLVNRADSPGGIDPSDLGRALGRVPEHRIVSEGRLVGPSQQRGRAVRARPNAGARQISHGRRADRAPSSLGAPPGSPAGGRGRER